MYPARTPQAARGTRRPGRSCQARTGRSQQRRRRSGRFPPCKARTRRCPSRGRSCQRGTRAEPRCQWCKRGPVGKPHNRPPTRGPSCSSSCQPRTGAAPPRPVGSSCPANTPCTPWRRRRPDTRPQGTSHKCRAPRVRQEYPANTAPARCCRLSRRGPQGRRYTRPARRGLWRSRRSRQDRAVAPPRLLGSRCPANTPCTPWRRRRPDTRPQGTCRMPPSARMARSCPLRTLSALRRRLRRKSQARKAHNRPG
mmetsp:Transcript_13848/g.43544  ORF Transcript_13848/g.43544 Transcript_13848/m.43544 type:complete len:253 (-) Transcript_13848:515-1273(-)